MEVVNMKKLVLMLLVLIAVMPLANAAVEPTTFVLWPYGDTIEELQASGDYYLELQKSGDYLVSLSTTSTADTSLRVSLTSTVDPVLVDPWQAGDAAYECEEAGASCGFSYKFDDWKESIPSGQYSVSGGNTIEISNSNAYTFDWESEYPVCAVIVKAKTQANVYYYDSAYGDTGLVAPLGPDGTREISHVTFCYSGGTQEIPEFPTIALPIAAILGLAFVFMRRK